MTTPEIERELTAVLHRHAEAAMSRTDTHEELIELQDRVTRPPGGRGRRGVVAGIAAAAAAAAVVGGAFLVVDDSGRGDDDAAQDVDQPTAAEQAAQEFLSAFTAGDVAGARSMLVEGVTLPQEARFQIRLNRAFSIEHDVKPCETTSTSAFGTRLVCAFDYHAYHSDEMGVGPFGNNSFVVVVDAEGGIRSVQSAYNYQNNGDQQLYDEIGAWVRENHPGDWQFMDSVREVSSDEHARWTQLWQQRTQEYADSVASD